MEVEADIGAGLPRTVLVGLPDSALYQARDRCKAAVSNSAQEWPISLLTINLSPATLPKAGSHYDECVLPNFTGACGAGHGVATQEADCRELAPSLGWTVVTVHTDNDLSAQSGRRRPGYEALFAEIRAGAIDSVIAWHTDRLHRSPVEPHANIVACETAG